MGDPNRLAKVAFGAGVVALVLSLIPWFFADYFAPPSKPIDETIASVAGKVKDRMAARAKGERYDPVPDVPDARVIWHSRVDQAAISLGVLSLVLAAMAFNRKGDTRTCGTAAAFALAAIAIPGMMLVACIIAVGIVIGAVVIAFGGGF